MKNVGQWYESKFTYKDGTLIASRNPRELQVASRLVADIVARHYQAYLREHASGNLIDLGCGKVPLYHVYKDCVESNLCVDWSNTLNKNPFIDFYCDLTQRLPFEDKQFDTVLLSDVLEHIPEPEKLWSEMVRIMRPGGKLIMNVPFFYNIHETPHDYYRYTEYALRRFAENSRLNVLVLKSIGGLPEILADLLAKLVSRFPLVGTGLAISVQFACNVFIKTSLGRKLSTKTSKQFPLGYFMIAEKMI